MTLLILVTFALAAGDDGPLFPIRQKFDAEKGTTYKQGYMDREGNVVIEPQFSQCKPFSEGMALVAQDGDWGYIDRTGKLVIPTEHRWACDFSDGLAQVMVVKKSEGETELLCGYIDQSGKTAIEPKFGFNRMLGSEESPFTNGSACVALDKKWGLIDKKGGFIIEPCSDIQFFFCEDLACIKKDSRYGYIDREGKTVLEPRFDAAEGFSDGRACVKKGDKWGFIDRSGKTVVDFTLDEASSFSEGLAAVVRNGKAAYIDLTGNTAFEIESDKRLGFSEGLAWVCVNEKWGCIDRKGEFVFEPRFTNLYAPHFKEGLARVRVEMEYGFIDKAGKMVIEPQFSSAEDFCSGLSFTTKGSFPTTYAYIDKEGDVIWKLEG
jgi:hypothetical protein